MCFANAAGESAAARFFEGAEETDEEENATASCSLQKSTSMSRLSRTRSKRSRCDAITSKLAKWNEIFAPAPFRRYVTYKIVGLYT